MEIPISIHRLHVLEAIDEVSRRRVPKSRRPSKFDLVIGAKRLPPRYVLSVAARIATGTEFSPDEFSEDQANGFLPSLGFAIRRRRSDWTPAECYMAVWVYDRIDRDREMNKAALYREVAEIIGRAPKSVEWKVQNVSACDPRPRREKPISQAANKQALLEGVFKEYWSNREQARQRRAHVLQQLSFDMHGDSTELFRRPSGGTLSSKKARQAFTNRSAESGQESSFDLRESSFAVRIV